MDWQQIVSIAIVILAAYLLLRREMQRRKKIRQGGCGLDCSCAPRGDKAGVRGG